MDRYKTDLHSYEAFVTPGRGSSCPRARGARAPSLRSSTARAPPSAASSSSWPARATGSRSSSGDSSQVSREPETRL